MDCNYCGKDTRRVQDIFHAYGIGFNMLTVYACCERGARKILRKEYGYKKLPGGSAVYKYKEGNRS